MYTNDPLRDFENHCYEQEQWLKRRPICCECKEHIQDEQALHIGNKWYCEKCINENTEYIED